MFNGRGGGGGGGGGGCGDGVGRERGGVCDDDRFSQMLNGVGW